MTSEQSLIVVAGEHDDETDKLADLFANLPDKSGMLLEIFARLPPPVLFKFRSVSKSFLELTTQPKFTAKHYVSFRNNTITAFLYQFKESPDYHYHLDFLYHEPIFLPIEHEAGPLPDPCLNFLKQKENNDVVELLDSCNGLLLCSITNAVYKWNVTCFVCNPLTKEKVFLPHPRKPDKSIYFALLADFDPNDYLQYKVLCLYRRTPGGPRHSSSKIFVLSSHTEKWEDIKHEFPPVCHETMMGSKVFVNGTLYWDCLEGHILVYRLNPKKNQSSYELIEAPRAPLGRCLWKSEENKIRCYCHGFPNEFPAWTLSMNEKNEFKWEIDGCEDFETLTDDISRMYTEGWLILSKIKANTPRVRFKIIGFQPKSKTVFVLISNMIYSYKVSDRSFNLLGGSNRGWQYGYRGWQNVSQPKFHTLHHFQSYSHSLGRIQTWDIANAQTDGESEVEENVRGEGEYSSLPGRSSCSDKKEKMKTGKKVIFSGVDEIWEF